MRWWQLFLWGGAGGAAPSVLQLARQGMGGDLAKWFEDSLWAAGGSALIGLAMYFIVGGVVANLLKVQTRMQTFTAGIGAPAMVVATLSAPAKLDPATQVSWNLLVAPAFAQEVVPQGPLKLDWGWVANGAPLEYRFYDAAGKPLDAGVVKPELNTTNQLPVPPGATKVVIWGEAVNPVAVSLDDPDRSVDLFIRRNYTNDFLKVLGNAKKQPYDIDLSKNP